MMGQNVYHEPNVHAAAHICVVSQVKTLYMLKFSTS